MSGFDAAWLELREPADAAARSVALEGALAVALGGHGGTLACVDLACGTGANLRRLAPRLPGPQRWRLVDSDAALLEEARRRCTDLRDADGEPVEVAYVQADLSQMPAKMAEWQAFTEAVLQPFQKYQVPVIAMGKGTSKEAVCLVFE